MIRLTWLQFRAQAVVALSGLAVVAIILAVTGPHVAQLYNGSGVAACQAGSRCAALATSLLNKLAGPDVDVYYLGIGILLILPLLIGAFWGAPLVSRELETGSFRLSWTQGVTRTRWLAVKLAVPGLAAMATAGLLSLMLTWWSGPIDAAATLKANNSLTFIRLGILLFPTRGITPIGYAAFAFTLGVTAGVLIRRTIPAMAVTLAAFAAIQITWAIWVRQHLLAPVHKTVALTAANLFSLGQNGSSNSLTVYPPPSANSPGSLILATETLTPGGRVFNAATIRACRIQNGCRQALAPLHLHDLITYQPGSRFWPLQWYETALFLVLTAILAGVCLWRIRRHAA